MSKENKNDDSSLYSLNKRGDVVLNHLPIVKMLKAKYHTFSYKSNVYVYQNGIYIRGKEILESEISNIAMEAGVKSSITRPTYEIMHYLKTLYTKHIYPFNQCPDAVPVNNGVVHIDFNSQTFELVPHDPKYKFNYKFTVDWENIDEDVERVIHNKTFVKYVEPEDVKVLYQIFAQPILQALGSAPFKKAYLLQGDPDAAKSTFLEIPLRLFGREAHSHVSLQRMTDDRFALAELEGKMLNVYDDLSNVPMKDAGVFKTTTGSIVQGIQRKGETGYDADICAVQLYTCNSPPEVGDRVQRDTAFWERWEYIRFTGHFTNNPYFLDDILTPYNMSVLLYDVLKHVIEIRANGLYSNSTAGEVRELWNYNADPLYKFLETCFDDSETTIYIEKEKLLESYQRWCAANDVEGHKIHPTANSFTRALDKYQIVDGKVTTSDGLRPRCYTLSKKWSYDCGFACDCLLPKRSQSTL